MGGLAGGFIVAAAAKALWPAAKAMGAALGPSLIGWAAGWAGENARVLRAGPIASGAEKWTEPASEELAQTPRTPCL